MSVVITFVVRTYNEEKYLRRLLESIQNQEFELGVEVIVVDSESLDRTIEIANEFKSCRVISIKKSEFTYGRALNIGFNHAKGQYIIAVSGHCILNNTKYISQIFKEFESDKNIGIVYGPHESYFTSRSSEKVIFKKIYENSEKTFPNNANCSYRKSLWDCIKFDETLEGLEDKDFSLRSLSRGYKIKYIKDASVLHIHNENNMQVFRRFYRETKADMKISNGKIINISILIFMCLNDLMHDFIYIIKAKNLRKSYKGVLGFRISQYLGIRIGQYIHVKKRLPYLSSNLFSLCYPQNKIQDEIKK